MLSDIIQDKLDILLISETKLDDTFPSSNFNIPGFSNPVRRDRSRYGGGILLYIREDIPFKLLSSVTLPDNVECFFVEIKFRKIKWLLGNFYNPSKSQISYQLSFVSKSLDLYTQFYDNILILGDFNSEMSEDSMINFSQIYNLKNLVKDATCYKNPSNPSCIDLMLTNRYRSFLSTVVVETGLSDFHQMTLTALKTTFKKNPPKCMAYRDFKNYSNEVFQYELISMLNRYDINNISFDLLDATLVELVNKHAPLKYKYIRANQGAFMNKDLRKAIMLRSRLKNIFHRINTVEAKIAYKKQRNLCTKLVIKAKISYFNSLNPSIVSDNKAFWKSVKPAFCDKICSKDSITLIDKDQILTDDNQIANTFSDFSDFFSNAVKDLNLNFNQDFLTNVDNIDDFIIRSTRKFENHPSILKIKELNVSSAPFAFTFISYENMKNEIMSLKTSKATPKDSIPINILKGNKDLPYILYNNFNNCIASNLFPNKLKLADVCPVYKHGGRNDKSNYRPVSILPAISKIYERLLFYQLNDFFDSKLSQYQCGFRKGYSSQYCLLLMLEKWKKVSIMVDQLVCY